MLDWKRRISKPFQHDKIVTRPGLGSIERSDHISKRIRAGYAGRVNSGSSRCGYGRGGSSPGCSYIRSGKGFKCDVNGVAVGGPILLKSCGTPFVSLDAMETNSARIALGNKGEVSQDARNLFGKLDFYVSDGLHFVFSVSG